MRPKHQRRDDNDPEHQQSELLEQPEFFRQQRQQNGAENYPEGVVHASEDDHGHDNDRKHELEIFR